MFRQFSGTRRQTPSEPNRAWRMTTTEQAMAGQSAAAISARLDRLPATRYIWQLVLLLSLGGCFEFYDLFLTAYIGPGLVRSGLFSGASASFFGFSGLASFVAATFAGLFLGTMEFGFAADKFGRRLIFTSSLLWYAIATAVMAFQNSAAEIVLWRMIAGIGIGVELVTIDTYIVELMPKELRGRAFAVNEVIQFSAVPVVALVAWRVVPLRPWGFDGWRWVVLLGAVGAIFVWFIRQRIPETPPLLIANGIGITSSLQYSFIIAISSPFGPLLALSVADKFERKWQIVVTALL